ncbi:hypothetical protein [Pelotalea chapellei]|uniref:Uncharacterized protein n=1 Tax=Pelotalea chapellei TaxID=44671 RepID=A0ABS5U4F7_9BACT|nr:hypothetical protein [Pelotalea chapellei]MBT1070540.1 hypothetical protein [Pelotalea chapellei]
MTVGKPIYERPETNPLHYSFYINPDSFNRNAPAAISAGPTQATHTRNPSPHRHAGNIDIPDRGVEDLISIQGDANNDISLNA